MADSHGACTIDLKLSGLNCAACVAKVIFDQGHASVKPPADIAKHIAEVTYEPSYAQDL